MSDESKFPFVTFCLRCGKRTMFEIERLPQTHEELEDIRRHVAESCPVHGEISETELREKISGGEFVICTPVAEEIRRLIGNADPGRVS